MSTAPYPAYLATDEVERLAYIGADPAHPAYAAIAALTLERDSLQEALEGLQQCIHTLHLTNPFDPDDVEVLNEYLPTNLT